MTTSRLFDLRQPGAFRLLLAMLVMVDHLFGIHLGMMAVYLFFILSGFWIHQIWGSRYRVGAGSYMVFVLSRLGRLVPVMVCAMALAVLAQSAAEGVSPAQLLSRFDGAQLLSHVLILGYGQTPGPLVLPPAWTLDLEIQFYLLAPGLYVLLRAIGPAAFLTAGVAAAIVLPDGGWGVPVAPYLILFMIGMTASATQWQPSAGLEKFALVVALVIVTVLVLAGHGSVLIEPGDAPATSRLNWLLAIVLAPVALATVWRRSDGIRDPMLGDLSYIVYLLHWPLLVLMSMLGGALPAAVQLIGFMALLAAFSFGTWRFVDRPLNDLRTALVVRWARRSASNSDDLDRTRQSA